MKTTTLFFVLITAFLFLTSESCNSSSASDNSEKDVTDHEIKNVILMIGDGMGLTQITAGMYANGNTSPLEKFKILGLHKSYSSDNLITDSAAGATAFSAGKKTYNGAIGVGADSLPLPSILEMAIDDGLSTGLVVTCTITHATPACFFAHQVSRAMDESIAKDLLNTQPDILIGGGAKFFTNRTDGFDLKGELESDGYKFYNKIESIPASAKDKVICLTDTIYPPKWSDGRGDYLSNGSQKALEVLSQNEKGFFLMIEGSQIDWGGHSNDSEYIINETKDFFKAVDLVYEFARQNGNTLVIITADHETGGYAINGGTQERLETAFTTNQHTGVMIPVFAYGPGAETFGGIYENTAIFDKMKDALGF